MDCIACKTPMRALGKAPIRVGGASGGWHLMFGNLADAGESLFPLDAYRCPSCKRVEFFDLDESLPGQ